MRKPSLLIIFLTVFIDLIGFGIVLPMLPIYAELYGAKGLMIGTIIASYSIMQFFFAPFWGRLSDRLGRKPVILISTMGSTIAYALFGVAPLFGGASGLFILLGSRMFAGFCGANLSVASAYIADITTAENRSKGMGLIGMAFGFGFILGPFIGGQSDFYFGSTGPGFVASLICGTNFILACFLLKESHPPGSKPTIQRPRLEQWKHVCTHPRLGLLVGLFFLANFTFVSFEVTLPLLLGSPTIKSNELVNPRAIEQTMDFPVTPEEQAIHSLWEKQKAPSVLETLNNLIRNENLQETLPTLATDGSWDLKALEKETENTGFSPRWNRLILEQIFPESIRSQTFYFNRKKIGYLFAYCGLIAALVQGGLIGRLVKRFGEPKLVWTSLIVVSGSMFLIPFSTSVFLLLASLALFSGGSGVNRAPTMGMISKNAPSDEQGATLGIAQSIGTLARIIGPIFATTAYAFQPVLPYAICGMVAIAASGVAWLKLRDPS